MFGTLVENDGAGGMKFAVRGRAQRSSGLRDYSHVLGDGNWFDPDNIAGGTPANSPGGAVSQAAGCPPGFVRNTAAAGAWGAPQASCVRAGSQQRVQRMRGYGNAFPETSGDEYESWGHFAYGDTAATTPGATPGATDWLTSAIAAGSTVENDVLNALGKGTPNTTGNCTGLTPVWSALAGRCFANATDSAAAEAAIKGAQTSSWILPLGLGLGGLVLFFVLSKKKG